MLLCMCVRACVCISLCVCVYVSLRKRVYTHAFVCVCVHAWDLFLMYVLARADAHMCVQNNIHTDTDTCPPICLCAGM